jgi:hypothetical protein
VRQWGEGSNVVRVRADGEFPKQEDDVLISLELREPCLTRDRVPGEGRRRLGVDVARYGSDRTVLVLRHGRVVEHIQAYAKHDTMATVGRVIEHALSWQAEEIAVDVIGLGAGVYDRLLELRRERQLACAIVAVNVAQKAPPKHVADEAQGRLLRDWLWLEMARWLREDAPVFAADDPQANADLAGELASVTLGLDSNGHLVVEDKDSMRKRLGHSPDIADALSCTFAPGSMLPDISLAPALDLRQRPLAQRATRMPGQPRPRDASPEDSVRAIQEAVRRRWSVSRYDEYDDV